MVRSPDLSHYVCVCGLCLLGAALTAYAYVRVHAEIATLEEAQGYVDPLLQAGLLLGFGVMLLIVASLLWGAAWSGVRAFRLWRSL